MCGDYYSFSTNSSSISGSPLHVRGLLKRSLIFLHTIRITPACAGTTPRSKLLRLLYRDYPCMCGDYCIFVKSICLNQGSPLHMRGLLARLFLHNLRFRITPAYAGTTQDSNFKILSLEDHPCICGDYLI